MRLTIVICLAVVFAGLIAKFNHMSFASDINEIRKSQIPALETALHKKGFALGQPIYLRIFKESSELELWIKAADRFELFKTYPICNFSGSLGPKLKEGDRQSPEGFYFVPPDMMNPNSRFHLSFNLGFPNAYDRAHARTGSYLMVHGNCVSIGCYAMTDPAIEEIYLLAEAAFEAGQPFFRVHAFPFRMTADNMSRHRFSPWKAFWLNLKSGYDYFENHKIPPNVNLVEKRYSFSDDPRYASSLTH